VTSVQCPPCPASAPHRPIIVTEREREKSHRSEQEEFDLAVSIIQQRLLPLVPKPPTPPGKRYHTCTFTVTRNEHHLTEFLVRNLLAGVQHMWLLDDNRVRQYEHTLSVL